MKWLRPFILILFSYVALFPVCGQTAADTSIVSGSPLPPPVAARLDSLRKADNLEEWLYSYTEYFQQSPVSRVHVLVRAQQLKWRDCRNYEERLAWFNFLTNLGYYQLYTGNILLSIEAYEQAYRFYFDHPMPQETDVLEYVLKPLGNNYTRLGDYERAFFIHEKSLSLALEQNNKIQVPSIYSNLAICARWKGDLVQAQQYAEKGLQAVTKNTSLHGLLLSTLADILFQSRQLAKADATTKEAIRVLQQNIGIKDLNTAYWLESAYLVQGNVLKEKGDLPASLASNKQAAGVIDHFFKGARKREKAKLLVLTGDVLLMMQQPRQAAEQFNAALAILVPGFQSSDINALPAAADLYGENTLQDALNGKARYLSAINNKEAALQCYTLLFSVERKLRHELFSRTARQQQQKENRQWVESAIELSYDLWKTSGKKEYAGKVLQMAEMSKSQLLLEEMISNLQYHRLKNRDTLLNSQLQTMQAIALYEREAILNEQSGKQDDNVVKIKKELQYKLSLIDKQVREKYPMLRGYMVEEQPSADSLLKDIPARTTVVEFFAGQKNIYVIRATKGSVEQILQPDSGLFILQAVKDFVFNWFQQGAQKMMNNPEQYYREAWQIYHRLLEGVTLEKQQECLIIPDNIIGYLPFDALVTDPSYRANIDQWPFLIKKCRLFTAYSLQTFQQQQRIERKNDLFAGFFISFDSSQVSLPAVKKEYSTIRDIVGGEYFTDQQATAGAFKDNLAQVNLLHISTHSFLEGEEHIPVLQMANDKFFLFELYGQSFQPQLVVLSACRTGHGLLAEGEGIISLARGFTASGAGGIVAGLWNMHDESTAELMGSFYQHLAKEHFPADALHAAKLDWLSRQHDQPFKKLPYFWAGLVYVGDNQLVAMASHEYSSSKYTWVVLIGSILIMAVILFYFMKKKPATKKEA